MQSESDLKFITATLSHVMDQEMEGFSVHPLEVLADAVQAKRPIAFFPAGLVLAAAEVNSILTALSYECDLRQ